MVVLSHILFTMYIEILFYELKREGVGYHMNGELQVSSGTLMIVYYCQPSNTVYGKYAKIFNILFNSVKSKLKCFNVKN